jgi:hypothetical protein
MDQPEEILEKLERFNVQKNPEITRELDEYVSFVARTGDSVNLIIHAEFFFFCLLKNKIHQIMVEIDIFCTR